jgi:hypothetical protein
MFCNTDFSLCLFDYQYFINAQTEVYATIVLTTRSLAPKDSPNVIGMEANRNRAADIQRGGLQKQAVDHVQKIGNARQNPQLERIFHAH